MTYIRDFWWFGLLVFMLVFAGTDARAWEQGKSTPDNVVTGSATKAFPLYGRARWVYLRNHCATDLYFDFNAPIVKTAESYPLRLEQDGWFEGEINTNSVAASPAAGATASCNFTLMYGR